MTMTTAARPAPKVTVLTGEGYRPGTLPKGETVPAAWKPALRALHAADWARVIVDYGYSAKVATCELVTGDVVTFTRPADVVDRFRVELDAWEARRVEAARERSAPVVVPHRWTPEGQAAADVFRGGFTVSEQEVRAAAGRCAASLGERPAVRPDTGPGSDRAPSTRPAPKPRRTLAEMAADDVETIRRNAGEVPQPDKGRPKLRRRGFEDAATAARRIAGETGDVVYTYPRGGRGGAWTLAWQAPASRGPWRAYLPDGSDYYCQWGAASKGGRVAVREVCQLVRAWRDRPAVVEPVEPVEPVVPVLVTVVDPAQPRCEPGARLRNHTATLMRPVFGGGAVSCHECEGDARRVVRALASLVLGAGAYAPAPVIRGRDGDGRPVPPVPFGAYVGAVVSPPADGVPVGPREVHVPPVVELDAGTPEPPRDVEPARRGATGQRSPELVAYLGRLIYAPKHAYAEAYAAHVVDGGPVPADPGADWAADVRRKVARWAGAR